MDSIWPSNVVIENAMVVDFEARGGFMHLQAMVFFVSAGHKSKIQPRGSNCSETNNAPADIMLLLQPASLCAAPLSGLPWIHGGFPSLFCITANVVRRKKWR
jgi:hypothetical protein